MSFSADTITINDLSIHLTQGLGPSAFSLDPPPPCPIRLTLQTHLSREIVPSCSSEDSMSSLGVNYSAVSKSIYAKLSDPTQRYSSPRELMEFIAGDIVLEIPAVESLDVEFGLSRGHLHALEVVYHAGFDRKRREGEGWKISWRGIEKSCVVGLHPHERRERQRISVDLELSIGEGMEGRKGGWEHKSIGDEAVKFLEFSSYGTIESLAHHLAGHLLRFSADTCPNSTLSLTLRKPSAIPFAIPSIIITRTLRDYPSTSTSLASISSSSKGIKDIIKSQTGESSRPSTPSTPFLDRQRSEDKGERVFIALGSNIGDRVDHIRKAVEALSDGGCKVVGTSRLYESEPMYVEDQERFVNGVVEVQTSLAPLELLRLLKRTEKSIGRTKTFRNGPRVVDLDLVFYGTQSINIGKPGDQEDEDGVGWLEVPHPRLGEREFVLRPLADIAPECLHPSLGISTATLLSRLPTTIPPQLSPIIPFRSPSSPLRLNPTKRPLLMAIFNATADSFSDGDPSRTDPSSAILQLSKLFEDSLPYKPDIIDIGGVSTRPNSLPCTPEQEISRVIPLITAIRSSNYPWKNIPISVDTYRSQVAKLAIEAGANCINDVRGGKEPGMLEVIKEMDVPVIIMHSRGDSVSMTNPSLQDYGTKGVINTVREELEYLVETAERNGVKKWNIITDPGIGFAKSSESNLLILKNLKDFTRGKLEGYPMLVGSSRKGFIGKITGREVARERDVGDTVVNTVCAMSGVVGVLRVHDVRAAGEGMAMLEAVRDAE